MKKRPTRKKLLEALDQIVIYSRYCPVMRFLVCFTDENGAMLWDDKEEFFSVDDLVGRLMDKSITHRVVKVSADNFVFGNGIRLRLVLTPDRFNQTNIDAEFMERIMELGVKPDESGC